jgi:hypothetical protein|tara:strand:- start:1045 stop:1299 length:255 start_codon:yes stop_codon:yes gene_type:complete
MIITITNKDNNEIIYDVSKVVDESKRAEAKLRISKIGTLNVVVEALNYASQGHQNSLESLLGECSEAVVEQEEQAVEESEGDSK